MEGLANNGCAWIILKPMLICNETSLRIDNELIDSFEVNLLTTQKQVVTEKLACR